MLIAKLGQNSLFHRTFVGDIILNMHKSAHLLHLVNILGGLFLTDVHVIVFLLLQILPI
jgi:hypothetical protein